MKTKEALTEQRERLQSRLRKYHIMDLVKDMIFINLGMGRSPGFGSTYTD